MNIEELTKRFQECLDTGDFECFEKKLELFLAKEEEDKASHLLSQFLFNHFTTFKADGTAKLLEIIIRKNSNLALVKYPDNYLYRVVVLRGSVDLFKCYTEEFLMPYLSKKKDDEKDDFVLKLLQVTEEYDKQITEQEQAIIKGVHFNGAFGTSEQYPNAVLINREDYEVLDNAVEKYNAVIGRKEIVKRVNTLFEEV